MSELCKKGNLKLPAQTRSAKFIFKIYDFAIQSLSITVDAP